MKIASVAEVKSKFSGYLRTSQEGPVIVTKNGRPVAVLLAVTDEDEIERLILAYSPKFRRILEAAEKQAKAGEVTGHDEFWESVEGEKQGARP